MTHASADSFKTRTTLKSGGREYSIHSLRRLAADQQARAARLPYSLRVLLENLLRQDDGTDWSRRSIEALINWNPKAAPDAEIAFMPARVLLQDFTGVPCVVDLAAMRDAMARMGGDPAKINPLQRVDLVIDHSVQVDVFGAANAAEKNAELEYARNRERYVFLRWGAGSFRNFQVVPPDMGICHQVNLEYLASVVFTRGEGAAAEAYFDTLVGTDSHTPMVNALGVLGWGVGGIEAEAAMLGQPIAMLIPQVVGFKVTGRLAPGATATDLVLTVTEMLRKKGVVGKFVEYFGDGLSHLTVADRATLANMAPEYGATMGYWPVDEQTLEYLRFTGRRAAQIELVRAYYEEQGMFRTDTSADPEYSDVIELDLATVVPSLAGPRRPQDRVLLSEAKASFRKSLVEFLEAKAPLAEGDKSAWLSGAAPAPDASPLTRRVSVTNGKSFTVGHGDVVIAAITSCTNTSNPSVMVAAGLLAKKAAERGLKPKPWVKTSLAPGSLVVTEYLKEAGLLEPLEAIGFHVVGYGCTTCIGNSGPLPAPIAGAVTEGDLVAAAVLSGNRNFEGRVNPHVRANYLASPPLVVAYALAGSMDVDLNAEPLGAGSDGQPVFLRDIWPDAEEVGRTVQAAVQSRMFSAVYDTIFDGDATWKLLPVPSGERFAWESDSTYVKEPPFFENLSAEPQPVEDIRGARVLAVLGNSVTTDHISPAGSIARTSPAAKYLTEHGVKPEDFNSYGSRRGNHEVMMRGTFANIRLRNEMIPGSEGGVTLHLPDREQMSIYDAAMKYKDDGVPLVILAGQEYGSGSSRDWAAKGAALLGVRAVIAESFERIHRSNLVGMGVLPLQFEPGHTRHSLGLTGFETFDIEGAAAGLTPGQRVTVCATSPDGKTNEFQAVCRVDTPKETEYIRHGGILPYVLRSLLKG